MGHQGVTDWRLEHAQHPLVAAIRWVLYVPRLEHKDWDSDPVIRHETTAPEAVAD